LQVWLAPQLLVHTWLVKSHACPVGQSVAMLQPHTPAMHAVPAALPTQLVHAIPLTPHAVPPVPAAQVPPLQQPPLHA
jgi:hypothetical protein